MMAAGIDFKLTSAAFCTYSPPISAPEQPMQIPVPEFGRLEDLSCPTRKVWCAKSSASGGQEAMPHTELQEAVKKQFFANPTQWSDKRQSHHTPQHPDFKDNLSKVTLWRNNRHMYARVESRLTTLDAGTKTTPGSGITSVQGHGAFAAHEGQLEVGMCRKLFEDGRISEAVDALDLLVQRGCHVPNNLFYRVLKRCINDRNLLLGRRIHALSVKSGYEGDAFLATHLIGLYASHGKLEEAKRVFTKVSRPDAYNWAAIIFAYARHGEAAEAIEAIRLYRELCQSTTINADDRIYSAVLKACAAARDLVAGKEVHAHILACPGKADRFVQAGLVNMYAKCGSLDDARRLFDKLSQRDVVTWTAMIAGYAQQGMGQEALGLYRSMQQDGLTPPDSVTYVSLLQACASVGEEALHEGKQLHAQIKERGLQKDSVICGSLVNMYAKCRSLVDARIVFDNLSDKDVVTWTTMIAGYAQQGMGEEALCLYRSMQQEGLTPPGCVTYLCLLQACASVGVGALDDGKQLHAQINERGLQEDVVLGGSLVNMYAKCGSLGDARSLFDKLTERDIVACNVMLAGYAQQGMGQEVLSLYRSLQQNGFTPNSVTYVCLLQACASIGVEAREEGEKLHAQIKKLGLQEDLVLGGSLVNFYAKCGSLQDARALFDKLPHRDVVTWTAMIGGYAQQGLGQEALGLYMSMQHEGLFPNSVTFVCLLQACAFVAHLPLGKQLHAQIQERGLQADPVVGAAVVNMYAKCGSMFASQQVFDSLPARTVEAWNALIGGYAHQGDSQAVFDLLHRMRLEGIHPNEITFLSVLTVCSYVGLVEKGRECFEAMRSDNGISLTLEHFICMVDLLGRAGHLKEALQMAKTISFPPSHVVWRTLLGACQKWKNVDIGEQAFKAAVSIEEEDDASYVLMSNIYASAGMWVAAKEMQARRKKLGAWKKAGQSWWTDTGGVMHMFPVLDEKHPWSEGISLSVDEERSSK